VLKLLLNPNILWQCDSCVVANDSHSKIDERPGALISGPSK